MGLLDLINSLMLNALPRQAKLDKYGPEGKFGLFSIDGNSGDRNDQHYRHLDLSRQKTKGAEALELIIMKSLSQNKEVVVTDSTIAAAEKTFGTFTSDGSRITFI